VTIYIGSAHSNFEFNLPAGEGWRLKFLEPMSQKEAALLISSPKSVTVTYLQRYQPISSNCLFQTSTTKIKEKSTRQRWIN
jgi:hypothetical protein